MRCFQDAFDHAASPCATPLVSCIETLALAPYDLRQDLLPYIHDVARVKGADAFRLSRAPLQRFDRRAC